MLPQACRDHGYAPKEMGRRMNGQFSQLTEQNLEPNGGWANVFLQGGKLNQQLLTENAPLLHSRPGVSLQWLLTRNTEFGDAAAVLSMPEPNLIRQVSSKEDREPLPTGHQTFFFESTVRF